MDSYIEDTGDTIDNIYLLFVEDDPSSVIAREYCNSHHYPLDLSFEFDMTMDTSLQHL